MKGEERSLTLVETACEHLSVEERSLATATKARMTGEVGQDLSDDSPGDFEATQRQHNSARRSKRRLFSVDCEEI